MTRTGRPTKLGQVLREEGGERITVADEIIERVRGGASNVDAAVSVGIARSTLQDWLREGARHASRRLNGERLTRKEAGLADFSDREAQAVAEWKVEQEIQLGILSSGRERRIVTEKRDAAGNLIEKTERTEGLEPDLRAITWRLERRFPEQYGANKLEISGPDGGPIPVSVREQAAKTLGTLAERLAESAEAVAGAAAAAEGEGSLDG